MRFFVLRTLKIATSIRIPDYRPSYSCLFTPLIECIPCLQADVMHSMDEFIIVKKALPRNGKRLCLRIRSDMRRKICVVCKHPRIFSIHDV